MTLQRYDIFFNRARGSLHFGRVFPPAVTPTNGNGRCLSGRNRPLCDYSQHVKDRFCLVPRAGFHLRTGCKANGTNLQGLPAMATIFLFLCVVLAGGGVRGTADIAIPAQVSVCSITAALSAAGLSLLHRTYFFKYTRISMRATM